ncbi:hypothetical protein Sbal117_1348 [Shewanella baltica OS117]|nr:hypothetical protein Sbal117_1348 [Shewanella baltica OS117]
MFIFLLWRTELYQTVHLELFKHFSKKMPIYFYYVNQLPTTDHKYNT